MLAHELFAAFAHCDRCTDAPWCKANGRCEVAAAATNTQLPCPHGADMSACAPGVIWEKSRDFHT